MRPSLPEPAFSIPFPGYGSRLQAWGASQMHAYADNCTAELLERIKSLEDALRMVAVLRQLGGMMPGSHQIVMSVVDAARAELEPRP